MSDRKRADGISGEEPKKVKIGDEQDPGRAEDEDVGSRFVSVGE